MHAQPSRSPESFLGWLSAASRDRLEGDLVVLDGGRRHTVTVRAGRIVAARAEGLDDGLVSALRRMSALSPDDARALLVQRRERPQRVGELAVQSGIERDIVASALEQQLLGRVRYVAFRSRAAGSRVSFVPRAVPAGELVAFIAIDAIPLDGLRAWLHEPPTVRVRPRSHDPRSDARRELRRLALQMHPDRTAHLPPSERARLARAFADATAAYHRLR